MDLSNGLSTSSELNFICMAWGCELNSSSRSAKFETEDDLMEHQFFIRTICVSADASEELHVVAVQDRVAECIPIATLSPSCLPAVSFSGFEVVPPVTFQLHSGQGPVYIVGQHVTRKHHRLVLRRGMGTAFVGDLALLSTT